MNTLQLKTENDTLAVRNRVMFENYKKIPQTYSN